MAFDALLQRSVSVELPVQNGQGPDSFIYRRQVASALHHRNILATLDIGEDHGTPYVVSEYCSGETLRSIIANEAPFDVDDVAILIEQLAQGLGYAHNRGIVHGALTPDVVIVDSTGLAKVTGFGMIEGQMYSETGSRASVAGSSYLPSTLRGNSLLTQALDVHALAAISYEMLTGIKPKGEDGYYSPSVINASIQERAGETVLLGLSAFDARTGLTASRFSHALTHWRSWTLQHPHDPGGSGQGTAIGAVPTMPPVTPPYSWPQFDQPARLERSSARVGQEAMAVNKSSALVRWLSLGVLLLSIAVAGVYLTSDDPETATITEFPAELSRMFSALAE